MEMNLKVGIVFLFALLNFKIEDVKCIDESITIRMPGFTPTESDQYICTSKKINNGNFYVTRFEPTADQSIAHHILLFGCKSPASYNDKFSCGSVCSEPESKILYAWGKQAPPLVLPADTGFAIGNNTSINYLVLQVHYLKPLASKDYTGVTLHITNEPTKKSAGIFLMMSYFGTIPPKMKHYSLDVSCKYNGHATLYPFAFRTHAHDLSRSIVAYHKTRKGRYATEIGRASPQWAQAFYPVKNHVVIQNGDYLAARCIYDSMNKQKDTIIGSTHMDEMCNFYIMYATQSGGSNKKSEYEDDFVCGGNLFPNLIDSLPSSSTDYLPMLIPKNFFVSEENKAILPDANIWFDKEWKIDSTLGQVSGVSFNKDNQLLVFHRANREWKEQTFSDEFLMIENTFIEENTILIVNPSNGKIISQWGSNLFLLPHGIYADRFTNDVWITDVGAHTVMRFTANQWKKPSLLLGTPREPGDDKRHFCQPADVVTNAKGEIFVADGYCNSRIVKFSPTGDYIKSWGSTHEAFNIVHSLTIIDHLEWICLADRERAGIECFDFDGSFKQRITGGKSNEKVFAIEWDHVFKRLLGVSIIGSLPYPQSAYGFVMNMTGTSTNHDPIIIQWNNKEQNILTTPHDLTISPNGREIFVALLNERKISKFFVKEDTNYLQNMPTLSIADDPFYSMGNKVSLIIGLFLLVPVCLICFIIIIMRICRYRRMKQNKSHHDKFGHGKRNRRLDKGPGFQPLLQEESDMEETVSLNLPSADSYKILEQNGHVSDSDKNGTLDA